MSDDNVPVPNTDHTQVRKTNNMHLLFSYITSVITKLILIFLN